MNFHFKARTDGTVEMPFEMTNDDWLHGFCARIHMSSAIKREIPQVTCYSTLRLQNTASTLRPQAMNEFSTSIGPFRHRLM